MLYYVNNYLKVVDFQPGKSLQVFKSLYSVLTSISVGLEKQYGVLRTLTQIDFRRTPSSQLLLGFRMFHKITGHLGTRVGAGKCIRPVLSPSDRLPECRLPFPAAEFRIKPISDKPAKITF